MEILLNSYKNINAVNIDSFQKIELSNRVSEITEYEYNNTLSATEVFDAEREYYQNYRVYGRFEYLSLLNNLRVDYSGSTDFFSTTKFESVKTLLNSFDFYLVKPSTTFTQLDDNLYVRNFDVIVTPEHVNVFPAGFSNNIYADETYSFIVNTDIDVKYYLDALGFPLTELFLYAKYKISSNGEKEPKIETLEGVEWSSVGGYSVDSTKVTLTTNEYNIGDVIYGDLIEYSKVTFEQFVNTNQTYYIGTPCIHGFEVNSGMGMTKSYSAITMIWKYNPFMPLRMRYFSNELYKVNSGDTSYEEVESIPSYAIKLDDNGNYIWRKIYSQGYVDPITGIGVDYPFVNKKRYLFGSLVLDVVPDLDDANTREVFRNIYFEEDYNIDAINPKTDLNNIGAPC